MAVFLSRKGLHAVLRSSVRCKGGKVCRLWHDKCSFEGLSAIAVWDSKNGIGKDDKGQVKIISQNNSILQDPLVPWIADKEEIFRGHLEFQHSLSNAHSRQKEGKAGTMSTEDVIFFDHDMMKERQVHGKGHIVVTKLPITAKNCIARGLLHPRHYHTAAGISQWQARRSFHSSAARQSKVPHVECDFVIVGAGSAGCVLANRLAAAGASVLLLEAGPKDRLWNWKVHMPSALMYNLWNDKYNWYYHTEEQPELNNRQILCPRGRIWGGSSALNGMVYVRGHAHDFDRWEKEGAEGWSYADCLPYFRRAQNHQQGANEYRGGDGPLHVSRGTMTNPLFQAFIDAGVQAGYPYTDDSNGYQQEGFGPSDMTVHKGKRWSSYQGYLHFIRQYRKNLMIDSKALVSKILIHDNTAYGVELYKGNSLQHVYVRGEVILSAGAINSPQLLMLSGVGDAEEIMKLGIYVHHDLPGVGQNLQDHLEIYVQHECKEPITLYSALKWYNMIPIGLQWFLLGTGLGATNHMESGGFIRSSDDPELTHPDIQFHFLPSIVIDHARVPPPCHSFQAHVGTLRPTSRGHVKLRSNNPRDPPIIDPKYLTTDKDLEDFKVCLELTREIFAQKAFDQYRGKELSPGPSVQSDKEITDFIRATADTAYHVSCTCKMGRVDDPTAVVDSSAKVIGMERLRVVDSSIMPSMSSGNLNAPTIMIAEKVADMILGVPPLPKSLAPVYKTPKGKQR